MSKKTLTLIVVPDHDAPVRRFQVERSLLRHAVLGAGVAGVVLLAAVAHYFALVREASENRLLRDENLTLRTQLKSIRERMEHIGATLERVERFDQ
ncbi:MAG TPA: M23 family peptidase, partial [Myxococcaceae bacterium]|nr:M23 family peptidase [Myxococcaceae bacterium]